MATVKSNSMPIWTADVKREPRFIPIAGRTPEGDVEETPQKETGVSFIRVWDCFVDVFRPGCKRIRFRVNHRKGRCITFTDRREVLAGTADATGIWNTRPALRAGRPRTLTPTGFQAEVARLIEAERAAEIVREIMERFFLESPTTFVRQSASQPRGKHDDPAESTAGSLSDTSIGSL